MGDRQTRTEPRRIGAVKPLADPMGAIERGFQGISQSPSLPEQRQKRRHVHCRSSFRRHRWFPSRDQGGLFDGLETIIHYDRMTDIRCFAGIL